MVQARAAPRCDRSSNPIGLGVLRKIGFEPDHEHFMTTILPVNFHEPSPVRHRPANVPAHGVEEVLLGLGLDLTDPLTGLLEPLEFNLSCNASHSALVFLT